ncbi:MAG: hypothetical protein AB2L14_29830 [Candidatus Xenobiia bacterium LiM19]
MDRRGFHVGMEGWKVTRTGPVPKEYCIGMSIGQYNQWTGLIVIECTISEKFKDKYEYNIVKAERFLPGTLYPDIAERMKTIDNILREGKLHNGRRWVIDITGVGAAIAKLVKDSGVRIESEITITAGNTAIKDENNSRRWSVPKKDLMGVLQVTLPVGRLWIAQGIKDEEIIKDEIYAFKESVVKLKSGQEKEDELWRERVNDDYVLAAAVAVWDWERRGKPFVYPIGLMRSVPTYEDLLRRGMYGGGFGGHYGGFR